MAELTKAQIDAAVATAQPLISDPERTTEEIILAVFPLVQLPLAEPTTEEEFLAYQQVRGDVAPAEIIRSFVNGRNQTLIPKPPDPRRERIVAILVERGPDTPGGYEKAADIILAELGGA